MIPMPMYPVPSYMTRVLYAISLPIVIRSMVSEIAEAEGLDPTSLADARRRPDWLDWEKAIQEELTTLKEAGTWILVDAPPGANIVGSKWVFRVKKDADGNIARKKARLVAQGFSQVPGIDYFDTFAPVARLASIRTVLALAARDDMELHQVDIKGADLNGPWRNYLHVSARLRIS